MNNFALLQIAFGLVFIYCLFGLVCSAIGEWFSQIAVLRPRFLKWEVEQLLGKALAGLVNEHQLIKGLYQHGKRYPYYIPASTFALALIDVAVKFEKPKGAEPGSTVIKGTIDPTGSRPLIHGLLLHATSLEALQRRIEKWFTESMQQASGRYKRAMQYVTLAIAAAVAFSFEIDTLKILSDLYKGAQNGAINVTFPIGDVTGTTFTGKALSAMALSLGASFWFDMLNKLVNLRHTGIPPATPPKERALNSQ